VAHFDKESAEYLDNGHYKIDGVEYMSVWAFKKTFDLQPYNDHKLNGSEGMEMTKKYTDMHTSTPDFGGWSKIYLFKVTDLKDHYGG